jgi:hypothetical protein
MSQTDVFALEKSGLNGFLFATVGTEVNGSSLTVLSTLARLGDDPWVRAASWARMSRAAAGDALAAAIAGMPLQAHDLLAAPATAERLIDVLFSSEMAAQPSVVPGLAGRTVKPIPGISAYLTIGFVVILALALAFKATDDANVPVSDPSPAAPSVAALNP